MALPIANAIWIGAELGPIHAACLRSFVRAGHKTVLHVYDPPSDVPSGVMLADARALIPQDRIVRYEEGGSPSLFANLFRYQVLRAGLGLYVDCDVYCVRPIEDAGYIFGWQDRRIICGAVLKLPPDCPILARLCNLRDGFIPPWLGRRAQLKLRIRRFMRQPVPLARMEWGTTGPKALTWYAKRCGLASQAAPNDVFYPVAMSHIRLLLDPDLRLDDLITCRTRTVHLWHALFTKRPMSNILADPPPSSPLGRIIAS
jgi:hypothetical protein